MLCGVASMVKIGQMFFLSKQRLTIKSIAQSIQFQNVTFDVITIVLDFVVKKL
jgi:hypothetical protein